jgi:sensor histidine kinase YesM
MTWYDFVFLKKRNHRLSRHLVFWVLWWVYFTASYYHYQQTGLQKIQFENWGAPLFIKSLFLLAIHVSTCYVFISFILPRYLLRARYLALITGILLLSVVLLVASFYTHTYIYPFIESLFHHKPAIGNQNIWWVSISSGLLTAPKVITVATAIKLIKRWYLKQKEKERLEKEKLQADLQLLKAQIHPEFLFSSLDSLYSFAQTDSPRAAHLLLKLSDLLSYVLYECNKPLVALNNEITLVKDYMAVVKTIENERLEVAISVKGETGGKTISPLLLLPFVENGFSYCVNPHLKKCWLNLELRVELQELTMKLINGKASEITPLSAIENGLTNVKKRLDMLYADKYELKTNTEPDMMITHLKIHLPTSSRHERETLVT